jgi:hypothetical protein
MKNKLSLYFIFISIFTALAIFASIVQKSYSNLIGPSQKIDTDKLLKKINPVLDSSIIQEIETRPESVDTGEINFVLDTSQITPSPANSQSNESSSSSKINQSLEE